MTWLHPALLMGLGLVAAPVLLHLLMRQKPKRLLFPALRLVQQRTRQNTRRFRLRHWWLLLLRMAALALLVLAVARPTLPAANYNLNLRESLTLAGVIAAGVGAYAWMLSRWRRQSPTHELPLRRAQLRGWTTGGTLLAALLLTGWPYQRRIAAEITSPAPTGQFNLPVAAAFVFDTSLSMEYTQEGKTRLDAARQIATEHVRDFPAGSRLAITDTAQDNPLIFQASMGSAQSRMDALTCSPVALSLNDRIRRALALQADDRQKTIAELGAGSDSAIQDRFIRRVYVFTDLATTAWRMGQSRQIADELEGLPGVSLQVVDVGDLQPRNTAIQDLRLSRQRVPLGGTLVVGADIGAAGESGERKATLSVNANGGQPVARDVQTRTIDAGTVERFDFAMLTNLTGALVQGQIELGSSDPLRFDDRRHFTAAIGLPPKVLVVSPRAKEANELLLALDPFDSQGELKFEAVRIEPRQLLTAELAKYDVVYLVNIPRLADDAWSKLGQFVEQGGGLAVVLGSTEVDPVSYNRAGPQQFLPARLDVYQPEGPQPRRFSLDQREHPLFWRFRQYETYGSFAAMENDIQVRQFWVVEPAVGATVLATYDDPARSASLLDRPYGRGRTVMFTTAVHLANDPGLHWNTLPSGNYAPWLFVAFAEQLTEYLARTTELRFNVLAGEPVTLPIPPSDGEREYLIRRPGFTQLRLTAPANASTITIDDTREVGHYELVSLGRNEPLGGFSVNANPAESNLVRLTAEQLDELLGQGKYQVARTLDEIKTAVNVTDLGKEVFPLVLLLAIVAFVGEHFVANWFYAVDRDSATAASVPAVAAR
ncbi:MAG: BatA domain-containing protein [Planctomyces sp.]|nr:BatA domain-containing protein [Planctomyces sp.]